MENNRKNRPTILAVDDTPDNLSLISSLLRSEYKIKVASEGESALKICAGENKPDLILLDIMMPGLSGYDVLKQLKTDSKTSDIPVIFLTALSTAHEEKKGLEMGAVDYITKPISPPILEARVKTQLQLKAAADFLKDQNVYLEMEVARRLREISAIQDVTILSMASLAETRDSDTGNHIRRTQHYMKTLADRLKTHPRFAEFLTVQTIDMLYKSAPLHDIGKVGIPDRILLKPGRFTPEEFDIMKAHSALGCNAIEHAENQLGMPVAFLMLAKEIAYYHHEKWDGSGYPSGKCGDDIPISARLMAVADVYDALISRRVYKEGMPHEKAVAIIIEGKGNHFDPDVVDAFVERADEFHSIATCFADSDTDLHKKAEQLAVLQG
ncbi:MAG: two-component system response regulator [Desulfuromonadales bacterium]